VLKKSDLSKKHGKKLNEFERRFLNIGILQHPASRSAGYWTKVQ